MRDSVVRGWQAGEWVTVFGRRDKEAATHCEVQDEVQRSYYGGAEENESRVCSVARRALRWKWVDWGLSGERKVESRSGKSIPAMRWAAERSCRPLRLLRALLPAPALRLRPAALVFGRTEAGQHKGEFAGQKFRPW